MIGRAVRFCSHKDLPKNEREVEIYIYLAIPPKGINRMTVDKYIYKLAQQKSKLIDEFENIMKVSSVDYYLNQKIWKYVNLL